MDTKMILKSTFKSGKVAQAVGTKSNTLARWVDRGLVKPTDTIAQGSGTRNEYSFEDIIRVGLMKTLADLGHSWGRASSLAFESAEQSQYGQVLTRAINDCIQAWIQYDAGVQYSKGEGASTILTSIPPHEPTPVYFVFFQDETGRLAARCVDAPSHFGDLYKHLENTGGAGLVNLMALIHKALSVLVGG